MSSCHCEPDLIAFWNFDPSVAHRNRNQQMIDEAHASEDEWDDKMNAMLKQKEKWDECLSFNNRIIISISISAAAAESRDKVLFVCMKYLFKVNRFSTS